MSRVSCIKQGFVINLYNRFQKLTSLTKILEKPGHVIRRKQSLVLALTLVKLQALGQRKKALANQSLAESHLTRPKSPVTLLNFN